MWLRFSNYLKLRMLITLRRRYSVLLALVKYFKFITRNNRRKVFCKKEHPFCKAYPVATSVVTSNFRQITISDFSTLSVGINF